MSSSNINFLFYPPSVMPHTYYCPLLQQPPANHAHYVQPLISASDGGGFGFLHEVGQIHVLLHLPQVLRLAVVYDLCHYDQVGNDLERSSEDEGKGLALSGKRSTSKMK